MGDFVDKFVHRVCTDRPQLIHRVMHAPMACQLFDIDRKNGVVHLSTDPHEHDDDLHFRIKTQMKSPVDDVPPSAVDRRAKTHDRVRPNTVQLRRTLTRRLISRRSTRVLTDPLPRSACDLHELAVVTCAQGACERIASLTDLLRCDLR